MSELLLSTPFRKLDSGTDWKSLNKYLKQHYKDDVVKRVASTLERLNELRRHIATTCVRGTKQPPTEAFVDSFLKDYASLVAQAQLHLPLCTGEIKGLTFNWIDCIDGKQRNSVNSNAEIIGCMMNAAASLSFIGAHDASLKSVDGVKNGFKLYQQAAGIYQWIPTLIQKLGTNEVIGDFAPAVFTALQQFCLAQAHHCSYLKAELEMRDKHGILSKLAMEAGRQYSALDTSLRGLGLKAPNDNLLIYSTAAVHLFTARAHVHLGQEQFAKEEMGAAIGRFSEAAGAMSMAEQQARPNPEVAQWVAVVAHSVRGLLEQAQSKNDTVYFARVAKNLPAPEALGRSMAKPIAADALLERPKDEPDPFKEIVPMHVASIASDYRLKMNDELLKSSQTVQEHREMIRNAISHLGIHAAIDAATGSDGKQAKIPANIRKKINTMRTTKDGDTFRLMDTLVNMIGHAANTHAAVDQAVDSIEGELKREAAQDAEFARMYGEKIWHSMRQPSSRLPDYQSLEKVIIELRSANTNTVQRPLEKIKSTLQDNLRELSRLDWSFDDLDALMPYSQSKASKALSSAVLLSVEKLKASLVRFDDLEGEETATLKELSSMLQTETLTMALSSSPPEKHAELLDGITAEFQSKTSQLRGKLSESDKLLEEVQEVMLSMAEVRSDDPVADEAQRISAGLEAACVLYDKLHQQLGDLSSTASGLLDKAESSFGLAQSYGACRAVEAEDFKNSLEQQLASKMKEVEAKQKSTEEQEQSRKRQEELQRQIAELEAQSKKTAASNDPPPPPYTPSPPHGNNGHVMDQVAQGHSHQQMDQIFGGGQPSQPYVYPGPQRSPPQQQQANYSYPQQQQQQGYGGYPQQQPPPQQQQQWNNYPQQQPPNQQQYYAQQPQQGQHQPQYGGQQPQQQQYYGGPQPQHQHQWQQQQQPGQGGQYRPPFQPPN